MLCTIVIVLAYWSIPIGVPLVRLHIDSVRTGLSFLVQLKIVLIDEINGKKFGGLEYIL